MNETPSDDFDPEATSPMIPRPGRARPPGAAPRPAVLPVVSEHVDLGALGGVNPLVGAANALLAAVPRIRATVNHPDPPGLRASLLRQISAFESTARERGIPNEAVLIARYALCTMLDEAVSHMPWGGTAEWARASLLVTLYRETSGGEKFFLLLNKMSKEPAANIDLLELFHVCLALGFEGRFRVQDNGRAQLDLVRERLAKLIRKQRGDYERDLSGHWHGEQRRAQRFDGLMPLWIAGAVASLALLGLFLFLSFRLNDASDAIDFGTLRVPTAAAPVARAAAPAARPRLATFLDPEIRRGLVQVVESATESRITISGDGLFDSGSAHIRESYEPVLVRVAAALDRVPGAVLITGHTDNMPSRTLRAPSNWHLSQQRADNVVHLIADRLRDPRRVTGEGMGDQEPVAPNDTPNNRALNRRVEIVLRAAS
jgi:type VI secretion system protein ImpK